MSNSRNHPSSAAKSRSLSTDTLADSVFILLALTVVQRMVGFVRSILFCRWLDETQLGQWDMSFGFLLLGAPLVVLALPGVFGRYVEYYQQRGQIRSFLRRLIVACVGMTLLGVLLIYLTRGWFSCLIFGGAEHRDLVGVLAISLLAVVGFNFSIELFTALRNVRLVAGLQLLNSLAFAGLGIGLLLGWNNAAQSVVAAYGGACLLSMLVAAWWMRREWNGLPASLEPTSGDPFWAKLLPFAGWIWATSLLANLFDIVDRYMIVHYSDATGGEALAIVGQYHSSRVVPVLLVSIAAMLGAMITPHLSHDWEAGRRDVVSRRLNLFVKLLAFALTAAATGVLFIAPLLFGVAFGGKFPGGQAVLPWTLVYCVWFGLAMVIRNYLWCAEKARLISLAFLIGLIVNVGLNLLLLPRLGLLGAVLATSVANLLALSLIVWFSQMVGFRADRGTWMALLLPFSICLGPWLAASVVIVVALEAARSSTLLNSEEKRVFSESAAQYLSRLPAFGLSRPANVTK